MKYLIIVLFCSVLCLRGCGQKHIELPNILSGNANKLTSDNTAKDLFFTGDLSSATIIDGIYHPIIVSGNMLIYNGTLTATIPAEINTWEYISHRDILTNTYTERMEFFNIDVNKSFSIHIRRIVGLDSNFSANMLCRREYTEGIVSKTDKTKMVQGKTLYIVNTVFQVSGPDIEPTTSQQMQVCFVNNGIIYDFSLSDYSQEEMETFVNSIHFF